MPKAVKQSKGGYLTYAIGHFPPWGTGIASVKQSVHDGDTANIAPDGHIPIRFLGIDTPEISLKFPTIANPDAGDFPHIKKQEWVDYLTDPFSPTIPDSVVFESALGSALKGHLDDRLGATTAINHYAHAEAAHRQLEGLIQADVDAAASAGGAEEFTFFIAFAYEVMDGYGRFLGFVDRSLPASQREKGRLTYNEKLLKSGHASPYLIWPNVNPFRKVFPLTSAVKSPSDFRLWVSNDHRLQQARQFVREARIAGAGIFGPTNLQSNKIEDATEPLKLEPFELRLLARRKAPTRYVIDLSASIYDNTLFNPPNYHRITKPEDRLFVPAEFVPLFKEKGWAVV